MKIKKNRQSISSQLRMNTKTRKNEKSKQKLLKNAKITCKTQ